jgi:hypothetical protein
MADVDGVATRAQLDRYLDHPARSLPRPAAGHLGSRLSQPPWQGALPAGSLLEARLTVTDLILQRPQLVPKSRDPIRFGSRGRRGRGTTLLASSRRLRVRLRLSGLLGRVLDSKLQTEGALPQGSELLSKTIGLAPPVGFVAYAAGRGLLRPRCEGRHRSYARLRASDRKALQVFVGIGADGVAGSRHRGAGEASPENEGYDSHERTPFRERQLGRRGGTKREAERKIRRGAGRVKRYLLIESEV